MASPLMFALQMNQRHLHAKLFCVYIKYRKSLHSIVLEYKALFIPVQELQDISEFCAFVYFVKGK